MVQDDRQAQVREFLRQFDGAAQLRHQAVHGGFLAEHGVGLLKNTWTHKLAAVLAALGLAPTFVKAQELLSSPTRVAHGLRGVLGLRSP